MCLVQLCLKVLFFGKRVHGWWWSCQEPAGRLGTRGPWCLNQSRLAGLYVVRGVSAGDDWPVMVGEFYLSGEGERIRNLDKVLEEVNDRLPFVYGCSGISVPQVLLFARAARKAGPDAVIAMAPHGSDSTVAMDMFRRICG